MDDGLCSSYAVRRYSKTRSMFALTCTCTIYNSYITLVLLVLLVLLAISYSIQFIGALPWPWPIQIDSAACGPSLLCIDEMSLVAKDFP